MQNDRVAMGSTLGSVPADIFMLELQRNSTLDDGTPLY